MARHRHILRNRANFQRMFDEGSWVRTEYFKILHRPNELPHNRIGIMVGRRFGNAVKRNRAKRVFREVTRHGRIDLTKNTDLVFFPRRGMEKVPYHVINQAWQSTLVKHGLVQKLPVE
ncbi:MAG TPA: ribonuclease P protein component [Nitrospirales bacterium]|nr:ribonuclease P protein component [Nitrospirales bacterium]HIA13668.1 ribonuclease P protein component [Nitrospirales bacterium]HIC04355.1 ribonuclease P protein component [Nitrospirales bacterium]HIN33908.1 ribonuclease P protein component [Nitrospirales bacterium]HIO69378.1 ribonuclease P protein component [Nitrospirales bacterium]